MIKTGIFVDAANIMLSGGWGMRYDVLTRVAIRFSGIVQQANVYVVRDPLKEEEDEESKLKAHRYFDRLRRFGYKLIIQDAKYYDDANGQLYKKVNANMTLAIDAMTQSTHLDRILLVTGDGDFVPLVRALQHRGCRVELLSFRCDSDELKNEVDLFIDGHLIPNLLPTIERSIEPYGRIGARMRGIIKTWTPDRGFGMVHFMEDNFQHITNFNRWYRAFLHLSELRSDTPIEQTELVGRIAEFSLDRGKGERYSAHDAYILPF